MKPLFKEIAACPVCQQPLEWEAETVRCTGPGCGRNYSLAGDVPILDLSEDNGSIADPVPDPNARSGLRRMASSFLRVESNTYKTRQGRERQPRFIASQGPDAIVLNVGAGKTDFGARVVNLDIGPFPNVDVVGRSEWLPVRDHAVDAVITIGVLEHVGDLAETLKEIDRVLRPGGQVFHEVPFIQGKHGSIDHRRFTYQGAAALVDDYELLDEGVAVGPSSALGWILAEWFALLFSFGNARIFSVASRLFRKIFSPIRYFDAILEQRPEARVTACSLFVQARKPEISS